MTNYNPVNTVVFKPRTYQELAAPLIQQTQVHQDIENQLADLAMKSGQWEHVLSKETDPETYQKYTNYVSNLNQSIEELQQKGLNQASRRSLLNSKKGYATDILPIETSFKRRKEYQDELRKMQAQDPTMMTNYNRLTIDNLINNPDFNPQYLSGAKVTALVENQAKQLANEIKSRPGQLLPTDNKYFLMEYVKRGYSADEIAKVIMNDERASPILKGIKDNVLNSLGVNEWSSIDNTWDKEVFMNNVGNYANSGLYAAIGKEDYKLMQDPYQVAMLNDQMDARRHARDFHYYKEKRKYDNENPSNKGRGNTGNQNNLLPKEIEFATKIPIPRSIDSKEVYNKWKRLTEYEKYLEKINDETYENEVAGRGKADNYKRSLTETLEEKHKPTLGKAALGLIPIAGPVINTFNNGLPITGSTIDYLYNKNNPTSLVARKEFGEATNEQMGGGFHSGRERALYNIKRLKQQLQLPFGQDYDMEKLKDMGEQAVFDNHYKLNAETWNDDFSQSIASNLLAYNQKDRDNKNMSGVYIVKDGKKSSPVSTNTIVKELHGGKIMGATIKDKDTIFMSVADKNGKVTDYSFPVEGVSSNPTMLMQLMSKGFNLYNSERDRHTNINQAAKLIIGNAVQNYNFTEAQNKQFDLMNTGISNEDKIAVIINEFSNDDISSQEIREVLSNASQAELDQYFLQAAQSIEERRNNQ